jgi:hypothetical protein
MFIWLLALVLVGGFAAIGFQTGAIRSLVSLVGILIGLAVAGLIGGVIAPLLPKLGMANVMWSHGLPAVIGFLLVWLIFFGAGFAAHKPVELHYKYREDDVTRQQFEKMNKALGLLVGMLGGVLLFFAAGKPLYSAGYLTTQTSNEAAEIAPVKQVNQFRADMTSSGWDKTFAALDRTPAKTYQVNDLFGLIHENPAVRERLLTYPPFLVLAEKQEIADILADPEYLKLLDDKAGITALLNNPKTQTVLANSEITEALGKINLNDLKTYLETGKSPLFSDEQILGRWRADVTPSVIDARRKRTNLLPAELRNLRFVLNSFLKEATAVAYPDGRFVLKISVAAPPPPVPVAEGAEQAAAPVPAGLDPALAQRYGLGRGAVTAPAAVAAAAPAALDPVALAKKYFGDKGQGLTGLAAEGTWVRSGGRYLITFENGGKKDVRDAGISDAGRLEIPIPELKLTLFFVPTL